MAWTVDPSHSSVGFSVRHMGLATVRGSFQDVSGSAEFDPDNPASARGSIQIGVASIDTRDERRDGHLRSPDFFDAEKYPTITFNPRTLTGRGDKLRVQGELTMHGVTKPIEFDAEYTGTAKDPWGNTRVGISASGSINRTEFGLTWNQVLEAGSLLASENVKFDVDLEWVQSAAAAEEATEPDEAELAKQRS